MKAIIFDLDDTLYPYEPCNQKAVMALREFVCQKTACRPSEFDAALSWAKKETKHYLEHQGAGHNRMIYSQKILEYLKEPPVSIALEMYDMYWHTFLREMRLNPGVLEAMKECRKGGCKIGICTDLTAQIQHRKLRRLGLDKYIDAIVSSEEAGREKPESIIFLMVLEKLEVKAQEAVYIGDSFEKDIKGAEAVGMKALLYQQGLDMREVIRSAYEN